jgi:alpha-mannosidase
MHIEKLKFNRQRIKPFYYRLTPSIIKARVTMQAECFVTDEPVPFSDIANHPMRPVNTGDVWGSNWQCAWFKVMGQVPADWKGETVEARLNLGGEGLVFDTHGVPLQGITDYSFWSPDFLRESLPLFPRAAGNESVVLFIDAAANDYVGLEISPLNPRGHRAGKAGCMELCAINANVRDLSLDIAALMSLLDSLPEEHYRYRQLVRQLNQVEDLYCGNPSNAEACRDFLRNHAFSARAGTSALHVTAVGHAHLDTAWLWPIRETIRKCGRTFASQLDLVDRYEDYVFGCSQPQHYAFVKEHYPALYERVKAAVKTGRWELQGGMWVGCDCNLASGESLIRQFLHGQNFYRDEFGMEVRNLWLPDVFGYSGTLPQIMRGCNCDYFVTQKLSWNGFNRFPHNTFVWRGLDGSEVLTHCPPENNYNSELDPKKLVEAANRFTDAGVCDGFLSLFGIGDGGAGPKPEHIEMARRLADLDGAPRVMMGRADEFLAGINPVRSHLDVWEGELYLEKHQGTLTTQAGIKRKNRKLEYLLKHAEFIFSCLPIADYPATDLDRIWKKLLCLQFHDILPGSSITRVYDEAHSDYDAMQTELAGMLERTAERLFKHEPDAMTLFNSLGCTWNGTIALPSGWTGASVDGVALKVQNSMAAVSIPHASFMTLRRTDIKSVNTMEKESLMLENELVLYEFDRNGRLLSAFDKENKFEFIPETTPGNVISLYNDRPTNWDAWDVEITYESQHLQDAVSGGNPCMRSGAVQKELTFILQIGNSTVRQRIVLGDGKRLDFMTTVNWNEEHRMLRVKFPVNVRSREATFDIQYGFIRRSTARNTSWDVARYEVAAHRYADLSDSQYGAALLNDCKYGYKVHGNVLDLNLLRSPKYPDFHADQGEHSFTYSFLPHRAPLEDSEVFDQAAMLNQAPLHFHGYSADNIVLPCRMESDAISMEVLKKCEDDNGLALRLVETRGRRSTGRLIFARAPARVVFTNMLEWTEEKIIESPVGNIDIELRPFEIRTIKFYLKS